jgi:hypothetical protein
VSVLQSQPLRAVLVGGGVSLVLLLPTVTTGFASWSVTRAISRQAEAGQGGEPLIAVFFGLWSLQRLAWGGVAVLCVLALALSVLRKGAPAEAAACSARRALVIALLPLVAFVGVASVSRELYKALRISTAVISATEDNPASGAASDAVLAAEGLPTKGGSGTIAAISDRIAWATIRGMMGSTALVILLSGLGALGFGLAWRVRPPAALVAVSSALWLLAGLGAGLVAAGLLDPLRGFAS